MDMRADAVKKAAGGAGSELNARERLALASWKLKDGVGAYPTPSTDLGTDFVGSAAFGPASGGTITFQGKSVTFSRVASATDSINEPANWSVSVTD
jgi:hypothetical protein